MGEKVPVCNRCGSADCGFVGLIWTVLRGRDVTTDMECFCGHVGSDAAFGNRVGGAIVCPECGASADKNRDNPVCNIPTDTPGSHSVTFRGRMLRGMREVEPA